MTKERFMNTYAPIMAQQVPLGGQCGGDGWVGSTQCPDGSTCVQENQFYHRCVRTRGLGGQNVNVDGNVPNYQSVPLWVQWVDFSMLIAILILIIVIVIKMFRG